MRKQTAIYLCILLSFLNKKDMVTMAQDTTFGAVPYAYVREADIMWSKEIWRVIDLREKINLPLYYPLDEQPNKKSLFRIIQKGIYSGDISKVFSYDVFTNEFGSSLKLSEVKKQ